MAKRECKVCGYRIGGGGGDVLYIDCIHKQNHAANCNAARACAEWTVGKLREGLSVCDFGRAGGENIPYDA